MVKLSQSKVGTTEGVKVKSKDHIQIGEQANGWLSTKTQCQP